MKQLIDKDALVVEIKRYKHKADERLKIKGRSLAEERKDSALQNLCGNLLYFIDTIEVKEVQEETVSEELEEAAFDYAEACKCDGGEKLLCVEHFKAGAKWKAENLWKPADGNDLPEIDREVIVFTQNFPDDAGIMSVAIAHRPNPNGWDGKSITTGKVEHYTPKTYGNGGWNIPNIVYWLDVEIPKEIEL